MQSKLKYKLFGEFADYEINELTAWFKDELSRTGDAKSIKVTIDWEPASGDV